jgi:hypothetical protein
MKEGILYPLFPIRPIFNPIFARFSTLVTLAVRACLSAKHFGEIFVLR